MLLRGWRTIFGSVARFIGLFSLGVLAVVRAFRLHVELLRTPCFSIHNVQHDHDCESAHIYFVLLFYHVFSLIILEAKERRTRAHFTLSLYPTTANRVQFRSLPACPIMIIIYVCICSIRVHGNKHETILLFR